MLTALKSLGQYVWETFDMRNTAQVKESEEDKLEKELAELKNEESEDVDSLMFKEDLSSRMGCYNMKGTITKLTKRSGCIDNVHHFFVTEDDYEKYKENDVIHFLAYSSDSQKSLKIIKILSLEERSWNNKNDEKTEVRELAAAGTVTDEFDVGKHDIIGKVAKRTGNMVILEDSGAQFNLEDVKTSFRPIVGDWLQLNSEVQIKEGTTIDTTVGEILQVNSISSLRSKQVKGKITSWDKAKGVGVVGNYVLVSKDFCSSTMEPDIGDLVLVDAIESDQGMLKWRALSLTLLNKINIDSHGRQKNAESKQTLSKFDINVSDNSDFGDLHYDETKSITITVSNNGRMHHNLNDVEFVNKMGYSQMRVSDHSNIVNGIGPGESRRITVNCCPKFYGSSEEVLIYQFKNFEIRQTFKVNVISPDWNFNRNSKRHLSHLEETRSSLKKHREHIAMKWIPGVPTVKPPPFVSQRLPSFPIPTQFWDMVNKCYANNNSHADLITYLEKYLPCLKMTLTFDNYVNRFHTLLYLEEVHGVIRLKRYDMERAYMFTSGQYLVLNVDGLSERRPSLVVGDSVKVQTTDHGLCYEGYIHQITSTSIYLKFAPDFHSKYKGEDVSVAFSSSRSCFMRYHQCTVLAFAQLGKEILFPDRLVLKPFQLDIVNPEPQNVLIKAISPQSYVKKLNKENMMKLTRKEQKKINITWYTSDLNASQKAAVLNVLRGESRPLPYIIFGPPGTGKTITVVETILQLLEHLPDSRLLVATPSNSSANNLAERLIDAGVINPGTMVRLVAHHFAQKGNISDNLKPFCATVDISLETSVSKKSQYNSDGIKFNCPKSVIGRHRITVGTCSCIGAFLKLGFSHGHFTHVIVDEAGQATEPELMVPLSFIDKHAGQIILAGDPLQLGPVVLSQFALKHGLQISYLERLLESSPYQKDYESFGSDNGGYDSRLVTRLKTNYRSIPIVLRLASDMFYDGNLHACLSPDTGWAAKDIVTLSEFLIDKGWNLKRGFPGIVFHGVRGVDYKSEENPSWFNPCEAAMVLMCTLKLYRLGFKPSEIGIVSPYLQQTVHIRSLFQELSDECPKTGSVEDFQGQERKIIILSTVRCSVSLLNIDVANVLGFVKHPKRLNVSLTRAKLLVIIFGDPHLLAMDPLWCQVIEYTLSNGGYIGCNLPDSLTHPSG